MSNYLSLTVPPVLSEQLAGIAASIPEELLTSRGPTEAVDMHVTLLSLGDSPDKDLVHRTVVQVSKGLDPFKVSVRGYGLFRKIDSSIIYAEVESSHLTDLHMFLKKRLPNDHSNDFLPHITLGYLKPGTADVRLTDIYKSWIVRSIVIDGDDFKRTALLF